MSITSRVQIKVKEHIKKMMFNRIINNNEMNKFFIYLQNDKSVKSHYAIQDINNKNEFYILYIDVPEKKYNKIIKFIT